MAPSVPQKKQFNFIPLLLLLVGLALVGGFVWFLEKSPPPKEQAPVLTQEARAYVKNLRLSDTDIKATKNYLSQMIVEINGNITNAGDRAIQSIELNCIFYDPHGKVALRQRVPIVKATSGGLKPGETKAFRLPCGNSSA